ncbi:MAG: type II toxin-antitoxin system RelE/ParE family toxin [Thermosynechococcaceae cyanobacterium]
MPSDKRLTVAFYRTVAGSEPVREWLKDLAPEDRRRVGEDLQALEFGWPLGMPLCHSLGNGLWEVRSSISDRRIARVIFCIAYERMVLLHAFIKKTQKTPKRDIDLALKRKKGE